MGGYLTAVIFLKDLKLLQWDGKIMDITHKNGTQKEDINAIVLSMPGSNLPPKIIGAPQVTGSTGMALAQSSLDTALEWTAVEEIFGGSL